MSSFTSRTVIAAFANIEETIHAVYATKLMLTERQRRMTKDAMNAAEQRAKELCGYLGYNPDDVYLQENLDRVDPRPGRSAHRRRTPSCLGVLRLAA